MDLQECGKRQKQHRTTLKQAERNKSLALETTSQLFDNRYVGA